MNIEDITKYQLIKRDIRELKSYLFTDNDINNWNKLIVIYNFIYCRSSSKNKAIIMIGTFSYSGNKRINFYEKYFC